MSSIDFTSFLKLMAHQKASDLFITAGMPPSMKVHGKLSPITQAPLTPQQSKDLVLNVMTPQQREEFEKTHECNFAIGVSGVGRFRVSCFYQRNQVGMVLRRIETRIPTVEELNLPPVIKTLAMTKRGIIIFVGATGTGKSTSLAAMIGYRNMNSTGHIITIEDPIEFVHKHEGCIITQREVGIDTDSWENALKNTLRQAPDVIMIGEVRTREGMDHAIAFAETGHLVLCTLHANNANQAMDRVINFFPEDRRNQLLMDMSLNLKGVVAQQLIPTVLPEAATAAPSGPQALYEYEPSEEEILAALLPQNLAIQIYGALLENVAGFFGSQMTAMDSATRNAGEMINKLTLNYNRTRQANITRELIEIISGAEAV